MDKRNEYLSNLPKVDRNNEIQRNSFSALNRFLPPDKFCLRDERIEDYGVDASLEVLENGLATNFRAQIQLKGTMSNELNNDGSYSLQIDTSNLRYLLNYPISLYILYIEPRDEFRFTWASNEFQRFNNENPNWINQKTITLRFNNILDLANLDEIKEQIVKQSSFNREVNETLLLAQTPNVLVEINPNTFEITDKKEILKLINSFGVNLVSEGYAREILDKINLLDLKDRENPSVQIVKAYAEYYFGHYHTSKEIINLLKINNQELSEDKQQIINWIEVSCDYRLGNIDSEQHIESLKKITEKYDDEKFSSFRFDYIQRLLLNEENSIRRKELLDELRSEIEKVPLAELSDENILQYKYYVLEAELGLIIEELIKDMGSILIRKKLGRYNNIYNLAKDVANAQTALRERYVQWNFELNEILKKTENQILQADIIVEDVFYVISTLSVIEYYAKSNNVPFSKIEVSLFDEYKKRLEIAIEIYSNFNLLERILRAESCLAVLTSLKGEIEESDKMLSKISDTSDKMNYAQVKAISDTPLSKIFDQVIKKANSIDWDEKCANFNEKEIVDYTQDVLESLGLPQSRFPNVKKGVEASREVCREKLHWCENIEIYENLVHTQRQDTYYAIDPDRIGHCLLHKYSSVLGSNDYEAVISAFKKTYCENCPDRKPKKNDLQIS